MSSTTHEIFALSYQDLVLTQEKLVGEVFGSLIQMGKDAIDSGVE